MTLTAKPFPRAARRSRNVATMPWGKVELKSDVQRWLEWLTVDEFATVAYYIDLLVQHGPLLAGPHTRQIDGSLRELRCYLDGQAVRLTYVIAAGRRIVLLAVTHRKHERTRLAWERYVRDEHTVDEEDVVTLADRKSWKALRNRRMAEPGAAETYEATKRAFELGAAVRALRQQQGWTQQELAQAAGLTQTAVSRFELGGTAPPLPVLERLTHALDAELVVDLAPRDAA